MKISVIKYDYTPASGKQYDVRLVDGANQRYVEFTRDELREKIDSVLSDQDTTCDHREYADNHCGEMSCPNYYGKHMSKRNALSKGVGAVRCSICHVRAAADGKGTPITLRHKSWCTESPLGLAIQVVVRDQREGDADMTPADAVEHARSVLSVDNLVDHGDDDDTYDAYKRVLEATEEQLDEALLLIR